MDEEKIHMHEQFYITMSIRHTILIRFRFEGCCFYFDPFTILEVSKRFVGKGKSSPISILFESHIFWICPPTL